MKSQQTCNLREEEVPRGSVSGQGDGDTRHQEEAVDIRHRRPLCAKGEAVGRRVGPCRDSARREEGDAHWSTPIGPMPPLPQKVHLPVEGT